MAERLSCSVDDTSFDEMNPVRCVMFYSEQVRHISTPIIRMILALDSDASTVAGVFFPPLQE
jgi:hypothetical protein